MKINKKYIFNYFIVLPIIIILLIAGFLIGLYSTNHKTAVTNNDKLLSGLVEKVTEVNPTPTQTLSSPTEIPVTAPPTLTPTPTPIEYRVSFIDSPAELMEGGQASFTWTVDGPFRTIHKSVVYFGTINNEGILKKDVAPADTNYTDSVKDFFAGDYVVPIRFIGNTIVAKPGKYYVRAYALIDSNNYWSEERIFTVKPNPTPGFEIRLVNYPQKVKLDDNSAFTWEITGPQTTTGFTAIVGAKESKSGKLDETIDLTETPYKVLVKDFTNGVYTIPLRYVGNTVMPEYGIYYIRALVIINGRNFWSDEYTLTVQ